MNVTLRDAFNIGFSFANQLRSCFDSRDVARALGCDYFLVEIQNKACSIDGFRSKEHGTREAVSLILAVLDEQSSKLHWTTELPTVPGWYWVKRPGYEVTITEVRGSFDVPLHIVVANGVHIQLPDLALRQFAGPIEEPDME